ncbi:hypothetical protein THRCLA_05624 [Thraustotheca clavata]|uniref:Uncharacterized protein n=1 Tax=Thraustotheca clavata TaxID=74557 RepID=A0A1V9ZVC0_9STRA|nr:hypothetical protein THRCLA_05624 [Thraustotheca clavata]
MSKKKLSTSSPLIRSFLSPQSSQDVVNAFLSPHLHRARTSEVKSSFGSSTDSDVELLFSQPPTTRIDSDGVISIIDDDDVKMVTPKRKSTSNDQKPYTPSSTVKSRMSNSLVFDLNTSLKTTNPEVAHAALRSLVALGKEYPTNMTFSQCLEVIEDGIPSYERTAAILASLTFVFDQASLCNAALEYPDRWEIVLTLFEVFAIILITFSSKYHNVIVRTLLVLQFMVYLLRRDYAICESRYAATNKNWIQHTRVYDLLKSTQPVLKRARSGRGVANNGIRQALDFIPQFWARVYDSGKCPTEYLRDAKETCISTIQVVEMLLNLTDQTENCLQRLQNSLAKVKLTTRQTFLQSMQSPTQKLFLATTYLGRTTSTRSTETEWLDCVVDSHFAEKYQSWTGKLLLIQKLKYNVDEAGNTKELQKFANIHANNILRTKAKDATDCSSP